MNATQRLRGEGDRGVLEEQRVLGELDVLIHRSVISGLTSLSSHRLAHNMKPIRHGKEPAREGRSDNGAIR